MQQIKLFSILSFFIITSLPAQTLQEILAGAQEQQSAEQSSSRSSNETRRSTSSNENYLMSNLETHSIGIGVGQTFLKSDFGRNGEDKITWDLYYSYRASHSFDFIANFHHQKHKFGQTYARTSGLALGIKARVFQFDNFSPYLLGGFGFYNPQIQRLLDDKVVKSKSKTTFGWHAGAGAELQLNRRFSTGILLHLHNPFSVQQEEGPDVSGWYYKLLITGGYTF